MKKLSREESNRLVAAIMAGDHEAFAKLYQAYSAMIQKAVRKYTRPDDIEDVCQLAWLQIYRKLHTFKGESSLSTWMFRVAVTTALMQYRKRNGLRHGADYNEISIESMSDEENGFTFDPEDTRRSAEMSAELEEMYRNVLKLSPAERNVVMLKLAGYSIEEIMEALGKSMPAVKSGYHNAVESLKAMAATA